MPKAKQIGLALREKRTHGGRRKGAGRPKTSRRVAHTKRPDHNPQHPLHIILRVLPDVGGLRELRRVRAIEDALREGCNRFGFRVINYTIQQTHLHMICEAIDTGAITRGVKGLKVRIARRINALLDRTGRVFEDRYYLVVIKSPTQARYSIAYVLLNHRHHAAQHQKKLGPTPLDPCSSSSIFDGWLESPPKAERTEQRFVPVARPSTYLLRAGWKKCGLISPHEIPGASDSSSKTKPVRLAKR